MLDGWSRFELGAKQVDVFDPPQETARFALLWLHGQDGATPAADLRITELLKASQLACVAPHGGASWWADRICPSFDPVQSAEQFLLHEVTPWITGRWRLPPRGLGVAGIEMGGQGALRLGLKHPKLFPVAAGLGSAIDFHELHGRGTALDRMYDSRERARQDTATLHMHPTEWPPHLWFACDPVDPWFRGNDRLHEKLRAYGVPHTADLESSGSDYMHAMLEPMLSFVRDGLERESRRLM